MTSSLDQALAYLRTKRGLGYFMVIALLAVIIRPAATASFDATSASDPA